VEEGRIEEGRSGHVAGYGAKNGSNVANASTVTLPDGRKFFGGFQKTPDNPFK
jgi:hypothetical protein